MTEKSIFSIIVHVSLLVAAMALLRMMVPALLHTSAVSKNMLAPGDGVLGLITSIIMKKGNKRSSEDAWRRLRVQPGEVVLEIGAGNGDGLKYVATHYTPKRIVAVEISERFREGLKELNIASMEVFEHDARDMSSFLHRGSVDKFMAMNVIYFLDPLEVYAREMKRVLRRGKGRGIVGLKPTIVSGGNDDIFKNKNVTMIKRVFEKVGFKVDEEFVNLGTELESYVSLTLRH
jgi:cyclopropane fatty-acyl-phospholipid synthase-like methyltransferase